MSKKKKKNINKKLKSFFASIKAVVMALIILVGILIWFSYHLMNTSKTYMFSGKSDYVSILNGIISLNYDVNVLAGSDIEYIAEKDYSVTKYKIGYYVAAADDKLIELATKSGEDELGLSLKGLINEVSAYNISEPYHNNTFFTKEAIKSLENGVYFIIEATAKDGTEILDRVSISLSKVSK